MTTTASTSADALIAAMKAKAIPVVSCVAASLPPARLLGDCTWHELYALVVILAEAADHAKLRAVVQATEDPKPDPVRQYRAEHKTAPPAERRAAA